MKGTPIKILLSCLALLAVALVSAQTGPPLGGGPGPTNCFPPPCIPIDGGLSMLIAAAVGIGGKKAYDYSKKRN